MLMEQKLIGIRMGSWQPSDMGPWDNQGSNIQSKGPRLQEYHRSPGTSWKSSNLKEGSQAICLLFRMAWTGWAFKYPDEWTSYWELRVKQKLTRHISIHAFLESSSQITTIHIFPIFLSQFISLSNRKPMEHDLPLPNLQSFCPVSHTWPSFADMTLPVCVLSIWVQWLT
jgi:hypothetical protein